MMMLAGFLRDLQRRLIAMHGLSLSAEELSIPTVDGTEPGIRLSVGSTRHEGISALAVLAKRHLEAADAEQLVTEILDGLVADVRRSEVLADMKPRGEH